MTEKQSKSFARRYPEAARAGWLLACSARSNVAKGDSLIRAMSSADVERAITYRDYCRALYASAYPQKG